MSELISVQSANLNPNLKKNVTLSAAERQLRHLVYRPGEFFLHFHPVLSLPDEEIRSAFQNATSSILLFP
jgi:hypothetical protein